MFYSYLSRTIREITTIPNISRIYVGLADKGSRLLGLGLKGGIRVEGLKGIRCWNFGAVAFRVHPTTGFTEA